MLTSISNLISTIQTCVLPLLYCSRSLFNRIFLFAVILTHSYLSKGRRFISHLSQYSYSVLNFLLLFDGPRGLVYGIEGMF